MIATDAISAPRMKWYEAWWQVWTHPGSESFRTILNDPAAGAARGFIWVGVTGIIYALILSIFNTITSYAEIGELAYLVPILTLILTPISVAIGVGISAGIYHFVARFFGGEGTWGKLVYCFAAVSAPSLLIMVPIVVAQQLFLNVISPDLGLILTCLVWPLSIALAIYSIGLFVSAIDAVENIGTGKALATYLIPVAIVFVLGLCVLMFSMISVFQSSG